MKIIDARSGKLQEIPFDLGEEGRGRKKEEIKISNREGQAPENPGNVGFFAFGEGDNQHVILTKSRLNQSGILVRINTSGAYTRGSHGKVKLIGGEAEKLTYGYYAEGDAGNIGGASDELWHLESPSIFGVTIQGGKRKGYGYFYLLVTESQETRMLRRAELCQMIATEEDPEINQLVKRYRDNLSEEVQQALDLAEKLDKLVETEPIAESVTHYHQGWTSLAEVVEKFGYKLPPGNQERLGGISGIESGILMPGDKQLACFVMGPGGGRRYNWDEISFEGLDIIHEEDSSRCGNHREILAIVEDEEWQVKWINYKDGEITAYVIANKDGIHHFNPELTSEHRVSTKAWDNIEPKSPSENEIRAEFGLEIRENLEPGETTMEQAMKEAGFRDNNIEKER